MNKRIKRLLASLTLILLPGLFCAPPSAFADEITKPPDQVARRPNVTWDVTNRKTVIVHMLNLTPYNIDYVSSDFKDYYVDYRVQDTHSQYGRYANPTVFSPSGIPYKIPAQSGASFVVSWLDTAYLNTIRGDDTADDNIFPDAFMRYIVRQVKATDEKGTKEYVDDVGLSLEFYRLKQDVSLNGIVIMKKVLNYTSLLRSAITVVTHPTPGSVIGYLKTTEKMAQNSAEFKVKNTDTDQIFFNAFILDKNDNLNQIPEIYSDENLDKLTSDQSSAPYDALFTQHAASSGYPNASIITAVTIQHEIGPNEQSLSGHLPELFVTIATSQDWNAVRDTQVTVSLQASAAGNRITQHFERTGDKGRVAFIKLARTLSHEDLLLFNGAYAAIRAQKALSREQEAFLLRFAIALEKNATKLETNATPAAHNLPAHKIK